MAGPDGGLWFYCFDSERHANQGDSAAEVEPEDFSGASIHVNPENTF